MHHRAEAREGGIAVGGDAVGSALGPYSRVANIKHVHVYGSDGDGLLTGLASGSSRGLPAALPPAHRGFTGRDAELAELVARLDTTDTGSEGDASASTPSPVTVVTGMAGVGKTALALEAAHEAVRRGRFPGGAYYVDLRGHSGEAPLTTEEVVWRLLSAVGSPPADLPSTGRIAAWQRFLSLLAEHGKPCLVLLDDAAPGVVSPLLHDRGHRFLVTSRQTLSALPAHCVSLGVPARSEAVAMLDARLRHADPADGRAGEDSASASRLVDLCGRLPLALRVASTTLRDEPERTLDDLADELGIDGALPGALTYDDTDESGRPLAVTAAFATSYRRLDEAQARMFRLLPLVPGTDVSTSTAAAVANLPFATARQLLAGLARSGLLQAGGDTERWSMHDLVRRYAESLAPGEDERAAAVHRLISFLFDTAREAFAALDTAPDGAPDTAPDATPDTAPEGTPDTVLFSDADEATAWLHHEHEALLGAVPAAVAEDRPAAAQGLFLILSSCRGLLPSSERWTRAARHARELARAQGDRSQEAYALRFLASALLDTGERDEGIAALEAALRLTGKLDDREGELAALQRLVEPLIRAARPEDARTAAEQARNIARELGDRDEEAHAQLLLAHARAQLGEPAQAASDMHDLAATAREQENPDAEALAHCSLGSLLCDEERYAAASSHYREAVTLFRAAESPVSLARALQLLSVTLVAAPSEAAQGELVAVLEEAAGLCREMGERTEEEQMLRCLTLQLALDGRYDDAYGTGTKVLDIHRERGGPAEEADMLFRAAFSFVAQLRSARTVGEATDRNHDVLMRLAGDPVFRRVMNREGQLDDLIRTYNDRARPEPPTGDAPLGTFLRVVAGVAEPTDAFLVAGLLRKHENHKDNAMRWLRRAAAGGHPPALVQLGRTAARDQDWETAEHHFRQGAEAGDADAMFHLGHALREQGSSERRVWWRRAADQGHAEAALALALDRFDGRQGHHEHDEETEFLFRRAVRAGSDDALWMLGSLLHERGALDEAEGLLRRSAESGRPEGMAALGDLFRSKSLRSGRAVVWWRQAAELGHTGAMVKLGIHSLLKRRKEHWWRRAAEAGDTGAMDLLATFLAERGRHREAERWRARASAGAED